VTRPLSHAESVEALAMLALDALDGHARAAALAHVSGCPDCAADLAALREVAAQLAFAADAAAVDAVRCSGIRSRLIARAREETGRRKS
jgi:hypothetical protein